MLPITEIVQIVLMLSKALRDVIRKLPKEELTAVQRAELRDAGDALHSEWRALMPKAPPE